MTNRREFMHAAGFAATGLFATADSLAGAAGQAQARPAPRAAMGARFRELLRGPEPLVCPAAHDALTARLIEVMGFNGLFIGTSAAASIGHALPDNGSISVTDILEFARAIADAVGIPALADADDFGGQPLSAYRHARAFEQAGIAAVMFDDRSPLGRAGSTVAARAPGPEPLLSRPAMVDTIRAAADARSDLVLIVRCYATDRNDNLDRCVAYGQAGADVVYPGGGLRTADEFSNLASMVNKPLMTTLGNNMAVSRMKESRIAVANGGGLVNIALGAVERALIEFKNTGAMTAAAKGALSAAVARQLTRSPLADDNARKYNVVR